MWRFNFDAAEGKPFFHPLTANGRDVLTTARPDDHPWHYGLWFSWKYINEVNYWEQSRETGRADGATRWGQPDIQTSADGSARISMSLDYVHPSGRIDLSEERVYIISPPGDDGAYSIDWTTRFKAGTEGAKLDRTPMPGEPDGQVNGGYAGLSLRVAGAPTVVELMTPEGPITEYASDRARPDAAALACNQAVGNRPAGGVAILSDPIYLEASSPWYAVMSETMRFFCSAILAPRPIEVAPGETMHLRYRVIVRAEPWTAEALQAALAEWEQDLTERRHAQ